MSNRRGILLLSLLVGVTGPLGAGAATAGQDSAQPDRSVIRVTGESLIEARPEQARIELAVVSEAETAEIAGADNARKLSAVLSALRGQIGERSKIRTTSYSLEPKYQYPRDGGEPLIVGYTATNVVDVTQLALEEVGKVIDLATRSGANRIRRLEFGLADEEAVKLEALGQAAARARRRAEAIASALGLTIVRVVAVNEGEPLVVPPYPSSRMTALAEAAPTPIEPGSVEIRASVVLTVEVLP